MRRPLPRESVEFRELIIRALWDERRFGYVNEDAFVGSCLVCGAPIGVHFHGRTARADLRCHGGCAESEVAAAIRTGARSAA